MTMQFVQLSNAWIRIFFTDSADGLVFFLCMWIFFSSSQIAIQTNTGIKTSPVDLRHPAKILLDFQRQSLWPNGSKATTPDNGILGIYGAQH
jgi:hypothetical protein